MKDQLNLSLYQEWKYLEEKKWQTGTFLNIT